jgi:hypothetical protein
MSAPLELSRDVRLVRPVRLPYRDTLNFFIFQEKILTVDTQGFGLILAKNFFILLSQWFDEFLYFF